jgi:hypothetical protein
VRRGATSTRRTCPFTTRDTGRVETAMLIVRTS